MHIEDLKRWHWIIISLVVGFLLAAVYSSTAIEGGGGERRTIGVADFLFRMNQKFPDKDSKLIPMFRNVRVYPPIENKQVVTLEELVVTTDMKTRKRTGQYQARQFVAEIPFALANRNPRTPTWTIQDELNQRKMPFTYAAWASSTYIYPIAIGGSFLLIGVIWPSVLYRMQTAGLGHVAKEKDEKADLWKARPSKPEPTRAAPTGPTREDMEQLAAVTASYERSVGDATISNAAHESKVGVAAIAAATARKWETSAVEEVKAAEKPAEEHEYGGEFYPVDRGAKKKSD